MVHVLVEHRCRHGFRYAYILSTSTGKYTDRGVKHLFRVCVEELPDCATWSICVTRTEAVMTYVCLLSLCVSFYVLTICRVLIFSYQLVYTPYTVLCTGSGVLRGPHAGRIVGGLAR